MSIELKTSGNYDYDKIKEILKTYNLLIFTTAGTYDTSIYNFSGGNKTDIAMSITTVHGSNNGGSLILVYNPKGSIKVESGELKPYGTSGQKVVKIAINTITNIIVKSKRNFLLNQDVPMNNA